MKKVCASLFLSLCLALSACSARPLQPGIACGCDSRECRIQAMVSTLYTLPDEHHINEENQEALWSLDSEGEPVSSTEALKAWEAHDRGRFHAEDFAPGVLEELTTLQDGFASPSVTALGIFGPRYSRYSINADFPVGLEKMLDWAEDSTLSCTTVESEPQEDGSWQFAAHILLREQDGIQTPFIIRGTAQFDGDGKFTAVHIPDDGGLSEFLEDEIIWRGPDKILDRHSGPTPGPSVSPAP